MEVRGLLLERGADRFRCEVVEVEQELVGVDAFDADGLAGVGWEVTEVEGDDHFGVGTTTTVLIGCTLAPAG